MPNETYQCPVCGYDALSDPAHNTFEICPCCGVQFGYDDFNTSHDELRRQWLKKGAPWFNPAIKPPPGWDVYTQLRKAKLN